MGPRQKSLGNGVKAGYLPRFHLVLQWGRGKKASEITLYDDSGNVDTKASMGPRQKSLGNVVDTGQRIPHIICFNGAEAKKPRK